MSKIDLVLTLSFVAVSPDDAVRIRATIERVARMVADLAHAQKGGIAGAAYPAGECPESVMHPPMGTATAEDMGDQDQACNVAPVSGMQ